MAKREQDAGPVSGTAESGAVSHEARRQERAPSEAPAPVTTPAAPPAPETARPAAAEPASAPKAEAPTKKKGKPIRMVLLVAVAGAALFFGGRAAEEWWTHGRFLVETDDAYVTADITNLAAKVSGYVASVDVAANQPVKAGDVIARLDDGDYRLALQAADDKVASERAALDRIDRQVDAADASVAQAEASVAAAEADLTAATRSFDRANALVATRVASQSTLDDARAARDKAAASLTSARAAVTAAVANVAVLRAQRIEGEKSLAELQTAREQAARDLSFTVIRAPVDGVVGNRAMEVGAYVTPGQRLAALVPLASVHIDANFKETQLADVRPGQKVEVTVDALGEDRVIAGTVESFAPATGSVFSLLPPENATGNFTKIVQRVPVRISLPADLADKGLLRPGLSVVVGVDTRT